MAEDAGERAKREFVARAPELRTALVAELRGLLDRSPMFNADEIAVLHHLLTYAGFALSGYLFIPSLSVLWGEEASYVPAAPLSAAHARAAVATLRRRGILSDVATGGVVVDHEALCAAASLTAPAPAVTSRKRKSRPRARARD